MKTLTVNATEWDLSELFESDQDARLQQEKQTIEQRITQFADKWEKREDVTTEPGILKEALDDYTAWEKDWGIGGRAAYYIDLRSHLNQLDSDLKAQASQMQEFVTQQFNRIQFFELRIAKIKLQDQQRFLQAPELQPYHHFLERIFAESAYVLSEEQEKIINVLSQPARSNWVRMTSMFLSQEEDEVMTEDGHRKTLPFSEISDLMSSKNKGVRDEAAAAFNRIIQKHTPVATEEMNAVLSFKKINDDLRSMPRPDLGRHLSDDIDSDVVDSLVAVVEENYQTAQRFYKLKARLLGVSQLAYHERNVEVGDVDRKYTYEEAVNAVYNALYKLDPEFGDILERFVAQGRIDVYPRKGKTDGAFCIHDLITSPVYVLLNYTDKFRNVVTLAHEMGHAINDELMKKNLHALDYGSPLSTAEVASTFMEDFVLRDLVTDVSDEERLALNMGKLNDEVSTVFRQIAFYTFEQQLHRAFKDAGYLPPEKIGALFQEHMIAYMGEAVEQSTGSENWWVYVGHFRSHFYVYSYASGLLISKALQASVHQDPQFVQQVKLFLASGRSASPKAIFKKLGIDITQPDFWRQGVLEISHLLDETEKLADKLGK
jgi:oligoendopeptidase F